MPRYGLWFRRAVAGTSRLAFPVLVVALVSDTAFLPQLHAEAPPFYDPFGPPRTLSPAEAAQHEAEWKRLQAEAAERGRQQEAAWLQAKGEEFARRLADECDDAVCLEGTLALLHLSAEKPHADVNSMELLERVANRHWQRAPGEAVSAMLTRLQSKFADSRQEVATSFRKLPAEYHVHTGEAWPLDWRARRRLWLGLVETMVDSAGAVDPAPMWQTRIADDPDGADWYRLGYLAVVRARTEWEIEPQCRLNEALLRPWLAPEARIEAGQLRRMAEVYTTAKIALVPEEHPARASTLPRLLRGFCDRDVPTSQIVRVLPALEAICRWNCPERQLLIRALVDHPDPTVFRLFADRIAIPPTERLAWLLGKTISMDFRDEPVAEAVWQLQEQVYLPLWIDESARKDPTRVTRKVTGRWMDVLESVLCESNCRLELLHRDLLWVGTPEAMPGAVALLQEAIAKVPDPKSHVGAALQATSELHFIEPPGCQIDYMMDLYGIEIALIGQCPGEFGDAALALCQQSIPAYLALSLMTRQMAADWIALDDMVILGPKHQVDLFRRRGLERLRREARLVDIRSGENVLAKVARLEFIETPIVDIIDYLRECYDANVTLARSVDNDLSITFCMNGQQLGTTLDIMLFRLGLTWDADGDVIYIGDEKAVEAFKVMVAGRATRRGRYPEGLDEQLQRRISPEFRDSSLSDVVAWLGEAADMPVALGNVPQNLRGRPLTFRFQDIPADVLLDVLCLEEGLTWRVSEQKTVVIEGKP
ncbi:MAG: hypothetical protein U1E05_27995 [Patescibacteria group bacterium]|nr:hypothetical protein [Patescibacteria group bacterium]